MRRVGRAGPAVYKWRESQLRHPCKQHRRLRLHVRPAGNHTETNILVVRIAKPTPNCVLMHLALQSVLLSAHVRFNGAVLVSFSTCSQCGVHLRHQCSTSSTSISLSFQCCRVHEEFRQFVAWRDGSLTMVIIGLASSTYSTMEC